MRYQYIDSPEELAEFAEKYGLRKDWHEPDEQGVTARVVGTILDNAFGAQGHDEPDNDPFPPKSRYSDAWEGHELRVVLKVDSVDEFVINLSTLLSWASHKRYE